MSFNYHKMLNTSYVDVPKPEGRKATDRRVVHIILSSILLVALSYTNVGIVSMSQTISSQGTISVQQTWAFTQTATAKTR
jgi:hypothetical protein